jgi:hypothetical protein
MRDVYNGCSFHKFKGGILFGHKFYAPLPQRSVSSITTPSKHSEASEKAISINSHSFYCDAPK